MLSVPSKSTQRNSKRALLVILLAPFVVMALGSWLYFYQSDWIGGGGTNNGRLLTPPSSMKSLGFDNPGLADGTWRIILVGGLSCTGLCERSAQRIDSIPTLLGKDSFRVTKLAVNTNHDDLPLVSGTWQKLEVNQEQLRFGLAASGVSVGVDHYALLADPLGNVILFYQPKQIGAELLTDLKLILKLSRIG